MWTPKKTVGRCASNIFFTTSGDGADSSNTAVAPTENGNVKALLATDIRGILAYSAVAHGGYILMGIAVFSTTAPLGLGPIVFYLTAYVAMNLGAFAVMIRVPQKNYRLSNSRSYYRNFLLLLTDSQSYKYSLLWLFILAKNKIYLISYSLILPRFNSSHSSPSYPH